MPQMEIPVFERNNPKWWVRKCERMFDWYSILEGRRVALVAAYFDDMVDAWYQGWTRVRDNPTWEESTDKLCERLGERSMSNIIEEFNKLRQMGEANIYVRRFEEL